MRARALLPAAALVVVAASQIVLTSRTALTPWKGGGFGMFSTLDHGAFRSVSVLIEGPDRSEMLEIPPSLELLAARAANCPAEWLLHRLADGVAAREARYRRPVTRITIDVWKTAFDPDTLHATEQRLRTVVHPVGRPPAADASAAPRG